MEELYAYRAELLSALEGMISDLSEIVARLPDEAWQYPIHAGQNTRHYLLFHLREIEEQVYAQHLPLILAEETPTLRPFDDQAWMSSHYHPEEPVVAILGEVERLRAQELDWLHRVPPTGWSRLARHPWWGLRTLQWWVEMQLDESYQHLRQLRPLKDT